MLCAPHSSRPSGPVTRNPWLKKASNMPAKRPPMEKSRLKEAIDRLPELYRTVFLMHDLEGYSHNEIASTLDVAEGTSKARLSRARAKLRDMLSDFAQEYA